MVCVHCRALEKERLDRHLVCAVHLRHCTKADMKDKMDIQMATKPAMLSSLSVSEVENL